MMYSLTPELSKSRVLPNLKKNKYNQSIQTLNIKYLITNWLPIIGKNVLVFLFFAF